MVCTGNVSFFVLKYYQSYFSITQMEKVWDAYMQLRQFQTFCRISLSGQAPIHTSKLKIGTAGALMKSTKQSKRQP